MLDHCRGKHRGVTVCITSFSAGLGSPCVAIFGNSIQQAHLPTTMTERVNKYDPPYLTNGGVLSNGYQLQHSKPCGPSSDGLDEFYAMIRDSTDQQFQILVQQARQMVNSALYQQFKYALALNPSPLCDPQFGIPEEPMTDELLAKGSRGFAMAKVEEYWKVKHDRMEQYDPGGRKLERHLELEDRKHTEEKKKRREKRAKRAERVPLLPCVIL